MTDMTPPAELSSCCAPAVQAGCCAPADKDACCGENDPGGGCGCSAGGQPADIRETVRERYAAAATQHGLGCGCGPVTTTGAPAGRCSGPSSTTAPSRLSAFA